MARRTKEDALATRNALLDAAECLFQTQGVSRTSLQDIARHAGATRGAVYWHFKDKADLFNAMMERVTLPMECCAFEAEGESDLNTKVMEAPALERMRELALNVLAQIVNDPQTRRVFEVATQKVEYVEELHAVRSRHLSARNNFVRLMDKSMETAARQGNIRLPVATSVAAQGFHALIDGLIQTWLLDPPAFDLLEIGQSAIDVYLHGLGLGGSLEPQNAPAAGFGQAQTQANQAPDRATPPPLRKQA